MSLRIESKTNNDSKKKIKMTRKTVCACVELPLASSPPFKRQFYEIIKEITELIFRLNQAEREKQQQQQ